MILAKTLLNEVSDRLGWPQIDTIEAPVLKAHTRKLVRLLNRVLQTIGAYNDWPLLRKEGTIVSVASLQTDGDSSEYVTATKDSTAVTVAGQSFTEALVGRAFQVLGDEYIYRIASVTSPTAITLNRAWVNDSITVADEFTATIAMDRYALPDDYDRMIDAIKSSFGVIDVEPVTPNRFMESRRNQRSILLNDPDIYTVYGLTDNQSAQMIHFNPFFENARMLEFSYQQVHPTIDSDQDKILYPATYLDAFIDVLLELANRDYEDNAKFQAVLMDALRAHDLHQGNPGATDSRAQLQPANDVRRSMRHAYGSGSVPVDWGTAFDNGSIHGL